jgi:hypothetical protein
MREGVREAWTPYRDKAFDNPFSLFRSIYTAERSIAFRSGDRCPLPLLAAIWNPDHMDKNLQIGTKGSVHGTDMYVLVYDIMYKY